MGSGEVRRPRRIIAGQDPLQPADPDPVQFALTQRFQRELGSVRRKPAAREPAPPQAARPAQRVTADASPGPWAAQRGVQVPEQAGPAGAVLPAGVAAGALDTGGGRSGGQEAGSSQEGDGRAAAGDDPFDDELVRCIVQLCVRGDPDMQAWNVTLPLSPHVLPQTQLHLRLSPERLSLRFQTGSPHSLRLMSRHQAALAARLQQALPLDREIDIELT